MFKYVRTMNSHISAPEICYVAADYSSTIYENTVYTVDTSGNLSATLTPGATRFIALEGKAANVNKDVKCLRVMPGMVFETMGDSQPDFFKVGLRGTASAGTGGSLQFFAEDGSDLEIVAHHYSENPENVMVTFI